MAVYSITHDEIVDALIAAHQRGDQVRVLMDKLQASNRYADDEKLEAAGIPVKTGGTSGLMFLIDGERAVGTGSFNWSVNADERNAENFVIIRLKYTVASFAEEFEKLWGEAQ